MEKRESASGLSKARTCLRKWAWGYMDGVWPPHTAENTTGTELHLANEHWLKTGTPLEGMRPLILDLFALGLKHLPRPMTPGLQIESKVNLTLGGRQYVVISDLMWSDRDGRTIHVYDYKSTKWAPRFSFKGREQYLDDVQFLLYARAAFEIHPNAESVEGKWIYYKTPKEGEEYEPKTYAWPHIFTRAEIFDAFARVVATVTERVVQIRAKGLRAAEVPGNIDTCDKMGGCHYATLGCDPMSEGEGMEDLDALFGEFSKPAAAAAAPKAATKPDVINAPEKALAMAQPMPVKPGDNVIVTDFAPAPSHEDDQRLAYDLFNFCRHSAAGEVIAALKPIARKLLG